MLSLQSPLTRIVDLAPGRIQATVQTWGPALKERQATPAKLVADPASPLSAEGVARLKLLSAGLAPLPFAEGRVSLAEPARRVAAALAHTLQPGGPMYVLEAPRHRIDAQIEPVLYGIGLLLAGVSSSSTSSDRALVRAANSIGQQHLNGMTTSFEIGQRRRIDEIQRKRAEEVKRYKQDLEEVLPKLDAARSALSKLGLDLDGKPLEVHDHAADNTTRTAFAAVVCPRIEVKGNSKLKDAVQGHEHMLGQPMPLSETGDLPARRSALLAEFPYAANVVDFVLSDLVSKPTVQIRPVLLTGSPGNGKTHFARRLAFHLACTSGRSIARDQMVRSSQVQTGVGIPPNRATHS